MQSEIILNGLSSDDLIERVSQRVVELLKSTAQPAAPKIADLLTRRQAASKLSVSLVTIDQHIRSGKIKARRLGRRVFIRATDLETALKEINL